MKKRSVLAMVMAMGMVMGLAVPASAAETVSYTHLRAHET